MEKLVLLDEKGVEQEFELLATFGLDDYDYVSLIPLNESDEDTYILRIEHDNNGDIILVGIEDNEELNDVILAYESLIEEKNRIE
ncbi:MAG TPA: DUF1292 domain-containing protein [Tissierellales bacterium]|nr:DUF1292 domain-containing protein [Tissierellales bacterium]